MDNGANGGNGGGFAGGADSFGAPQSFSEATTKPEADKRRDDTKKALGQMAVGYVDLTGTEIDKTTYNELKGGVDRFKEGKEGTDLNALADWRDKLMTESLDRSFNRKFGGKAVDIAQNEILEFDKLREDVAHSGESDTGADTRINVGADTTSNAGLNTTDTMFNTGVDTPSAESELVSELNLGGSKAA